jgi:predicted nucleic acid-binding protein
LDAHLKTNGQTLAIPDIIIAATALEVGFAVATANRSHFERIPGLELIELP